MYLSITNSELNMNDLNNYLEGIIKFEDDFFIKAMNADHARVLNKSIKKLKIQIDNINNAYLQIKYRLALIGIECDLSYQIRGGRYD